MIPDFPLEQSIDFKFTSRAFATGIPTTLAGTPVVEIYEDNSVTQITGAETLTVDFDGVTGLNNLRIVATTANGFESGKSYSAVLSAGTVGGVSVIGEVVAQFTIERSPAFSRLGAPAGASVSADIADIPTVSEFNARTLVAASYFDPAADTVANVTTVGSVTGSVNSVATAVNANITALSVDQIWDELTAGHATPGSFGVAVTDTLADTNELQADDVPGLIAALNDVAATDIVTGGAIATTAGAVDTVTTATTATAVTTVNGLAAGIIDNTSVGTLDNTNFAFVDSNERVDVGAWLGTAATSGTGGPDVNVNAIGDSTTAATNLSSSALGIVPGLCEGTPSTTVIQTDLAETTDDHYIGRVVVFTSGAAAGQATDITDYTGSTGTITVTALTTAPSASDAFVIV